MPEQKISEKRKEYIDALKVVALMFVIALHTQRGVDVTDKCNNAVLFYLGRFSMPVFFMVNGTLILGKKEFNFPYYKKKITGIIKVLFIWGCILGIYSYFMIDHSLKGMVKNAIKGMIAYHWVTSMWFFITFGLIYTILLFCFKNIKANIKKVVCVLGMICLAVDVASIINIHRGGFFVQDHITQRLRLWTWMFYFCLGYYIDNIDLSDKAKRIAAVFIAPISVACIYWQHYICYVKTGQIESNYVYDNILIMLWSICIFIFFKTNIRASHFFAKFAPISFGVFLLHGFFVDAFQLRAYPQNPFESALMWIFLIAGCGILSWIFNKIPVVKKAFQY